MTPLLSTDQHHTCWAADPVGRAEHDRRRRAGDGLGRRTRCLRPGRETTPPPWTGPTRRADRVGSRPAETRLPTGTATRCACPRRGSAAPHADARVCLLLRQRPRSEPAATGGHQPADAVRRQQRDLRPGLVHLRPQLRPHHLHQNRRSRVQQRRVDHDSNARSSGARGIGRGRGQAWCRRSPNRPRGRDGSGTRRCGRRALSVGTGSRCRLRGNCQTSYRTAQAANCSLGA